MARTKELSQVARVMRIRAMLDNTGFVTVKQLMQTFGICRKTAYNDRVALEEAGVALYSTKGSDGEVRWIVDSKARNKLTLGAGQVVPLGLAGLALSFLEGTEVHDQVAAVVAKLSDGATPATQKQLAQLGRKVAIVPHGPKSYRKKADVLDHILSGLLHDHRVEIRYRSPGRTPTRHVLEPLSLVLYREALYLIANSRTHDGIRIYFAVDRIISAKWLKGQGLEYPQDYDPRQEFDGAFGLVGGERQKVEIVFDADQARYVQERRWHPTQRFKTLPDGRVRMTMTVCGTHDVLLWLLGHTGTFEVVSPPALREEVRGRLKESLAQHGRAKRSR